MLIILCLFVACTKSKEKEDASLQKCSLPAGTSISIDGHYIVGTVSVPLTSTTIGTFTLHIQNIEKLSYSEWSTNAVVQFAENGKTPCEVYSETETSWKDFYQDMLDAGIHYDVVQHYINSISNPNQTEARAQSGVYAETFLSACGYAIAPGTVICGVSPESGPKKYYMPHENTHGFQADLTADEDSNNITIYRIFAAYANSIYQQSITDSGKFTSADGLWYIHTMDYALQNEAEWIAEIFADYLYSYTGHWAYISNNYPELKNFFDCVWKESKSFNQCQLESGASMVSFAQNAPVVNLTSVSNFTSSESEAVWNICFQSANKESYLNSFNNLMERLVPGIYSDVSSLYKLGFGDCNHDNVIDWICSYRGLAPNGGNYFWNHDNQIGAYTFIVSGKTNDTYSEYIQDPYLTLPTINGSLAQPMYREWQGSMGSCNGAVYFNAIPLRFPIYANEVVNLPQEFSTKVIW